MDVDEVPYETISLEVDGPILTVILDRPDRLNAFTLTMQRELCRLWDRIDADDDVRVVIVTGRGRGFCAGADLGNGGETFDADALTPEGKEIDIRDSGGRLTLRIFESTKPVIAAINGPAVGIGATMTLAMDVRMVAEGAKLGFVFSRRGIVPEACSSWFLPRIVGISRAMEWCATGRVFGADEALDAGLARSVHNPDDLLPAARELASEMATGTSAVSVALTRQMMWRMLGADHPMEAHKIDSRGIYAMGRSADAREGVMSFLEKRPAEFTMRPSADMPDFFPWWEPRPFE